MMLALLFCGLYFTTADSTTYQWSLVPILGVKDLLGASIDSSGQKTIVYNDKQVFYSNDFAKTWTNSSGVSCISSCNLFGVSIHGDVIYKLGVNSFQKSIDYGQTFSSLSAPFITPNSISTDLTGMNVLIAEDSPGYRILISTDSGFSFTPTSAPARRYSALSSDASFTFHVALSVGNSISEFFQMKSEVYYSHDSGFSWILVDNAFENQIPEIQRMIRTSSPCLTSDTSGKYVVLAGLPNSFADIFYSSDHGVTWNPATPASRYWGANSLTSGSNGQNIAIASGAGIFLSSNYGKVWFQDTSAPSVTYKSLHVTHNFSVLHLITTNGLYLRTEAPLLFPSPRPTRFPSNAPSQAPIIPLPMSPSPISSGVKTLQPSNSPTILPSFSPSKFSLSSFAPSIELQLRKGNLNSRKKLSPAKVAGVAAGCAVALLVYMYAFQPDEEESNEGVDIEIP
jgi:hypothetical protein